MAAPTPTPVSVNVLTGYSSEVDKTHTVTLAIVGLPSIEAATQVKDWVRANIPTYLATIKLPVGVKAI